MSRDRMLALIPGGSQTVSKSPTRYVDSPDYPVQCHKASGCYLYSQGRQFLDFSMGLGACILGYANLAVDGAVISAIRDGNVLTTLPSTCEVLAAEMMLRYVPWAEQVRFGKTGTDVTTAAVRVARAYTGRDVVLSHGYHGWADWSVATTSPAEGVPETVKGLTEHLEYLEDEAVVTDEYAAVVVEVAPRGLSTEELRWLKALQEQCNKTGTVLIFDEVLSGFRYAMGSAYPVVPDLMCFGKAIGNGYAISALAGKRELMSALDPGRVFFSGTSFGETTGLAAMIATLGEMERLRTWEHIHRLGKLLNQALDEVEVCGWLGHGARIVRGRTQTDELIAFWQQECAKRGILYTGHHNLSQAHDEWYVERCVEVYQEVSDLAKRTPDLEAALEGPPGRVPYRMQ